MKEQSTVILQLKSEKQRLENELKKHESMIKKLLNNTTNTNITNNTSNDIRIEIEKSILIKKLKQYATQLKTLIINKEIEIKELKKNSKITSLLEITIERDEYFYEVQRLKDQLFILQQEKLDWQQQKINILQSNHQQHNIHRNNNNNNNTIQPILPSNTNGSRKTPQPGVSVQPVSVQPPARPQSSQSSRGANNQHRGRVRTIPTETEETYIGGINILADQSGQQKTDTVDGDYLDGDFESDVVVLKPPPRPASPRLLPNLSSPSNSNNTKSKQKPQTSPYAVSLSPTNAKPSATGSINRTGLPFFDEAKQSAQKDALKWRNAESVLRGSTATPSSPPSTNSGSPTTIVATPPNKNDALTTNSEPPRRPASKPTSSKPNAPTEVKSKEAKARPSSVSNDVAIAPIVETDQPIVAAITPAADAPSSDHAATAEDEEVASKSTNAVEKKRAPAPVTQSTSTPAVTKAAVVTSKDNKKVTPKQAPLKKSTTTDKLASTHKSDLKKEPTPSVGKDTTSALKSTPTQLASEVPTAPPSRESEKGASIEETVSIISTLDEAVEGNKRAATVVEVSLPKETKKDAVPTETVEKVVAVVTPSAVETLGDKAAPLERLAEPKVESTKGTEQVGSTPSERIKSKRSPRRAAHELQQQEREEKPVSARQTSDKSETKLASNHNNTKADVKYKPSSSPRPVTDSTIPTVASKAEDTTPADNIHEPSVKAAVPIVEAVPVEDHTPSLLKGESIDDGSSLGALDGGAAVYEEPTIGTLPTLEPSPRPLSPEPINPPGGEVTVKAAKTPVAHQKADSYLDDFLNDLSDDEGDVKGIGYAGPGTESIQEATPANSTVLAAAADEKSVSPIISAKKDEQSSDKAIVKAIPAAAVISDKDTTTHAMPVVSHESTNADAATITPKAVKGAAAVPADDEYEEDFD